MRVFFVVENELHSAVIPSQVITPARIYAESTPEVGVRVVFLEPAREAFRLVARRRLATLRRLWPGGRIGVYPYVGRLGEHSPARTLAAVARFYGGLSEPVVFHCRGPAATMQAAAAAPSCGGARVIFDARGASGHESQLRLAARGDDPAGLDAALRHGEMVDRLAAEVADAVVAVSQPLLEAVAGIDGERAKPSAVIPCCVASIGFSDAVRRGVRGELGISDDELLLVHVSTQARWEAFDQVIALFRELRKHRPARLLFLTTVEPETVLACVDRADPIRQAIILRSVEPARVPDLVSAADVGMLVRRPHETHRMASPIKFAEYLSAGLAVVVSEGIGTMAFTVEAERIGVAVKACPDAQAFREAAGRLVDLLDTGPAEIRARALRVCRDLYTWERYVPVVHGLYGFSQGEAVVSSGAQRLVPAPQPAASSSDSPTRVRGNCEINDSRDSSVS